MKKIRIFIASAFVLAIASAFATQPSRTTLVGAYLSLDSGSGCTASSGTRSECTGGQKICKNGTTTFYSDAACSVALMKP